MSRVETGSSVSTAGSTETYWIVGAVLGALVLLLLSLILIYLITRHKKRRKEEKKRRKAQGDKGIKNYIQISF